MRAEILSVVTGNLTVTQRQVWRLHKKGLSQTKIALKLGVSRQAIHKTLNQANSRVLAALLDIAKTDKLEVRKVDPEKGILLGYSPGFRSRVFLIYSPKNGVQMWYEHKGQCEGCQKREACMSKLFDTAREWEVELTGEEEKLEPTQLAEKLFSGVAGIK